MKYIRMNWTIDADERERAYLSLAAAADDFAAQHSRRPTFKDRNTLVFSGVERNKRNMVFDFLDMDDQAFVAFLQRHGQRYWPLRVREAHEVLRLPGLPDPDGVFLN